MDISSLNHFAQTKATAERLANENVGGTETSSPASETPSDSSDSVAQDFDSFLELLTAQFRNQDPLAPLDSTHFVDQLATFSYL